MFIILVPPTVSAHGSVGLSGRIVGAEKARDELPSPPMEITLSAVLFVRSILIPR